MVKFNGNILIDRGEMSDPVKSHEHCLMCGTKNPASFHLNFRKDGENCVCGSFKGDFRYQGYDGILHGGVISALLDSAMTHCLFSENIEAVTADLNIRFVKPIPFNASVVLKAEIITHRFPLYKLKACLLVENEIYAKADARFIDLKFLK